MATVQRDMTTAGVVPGKKLIFVLEYSGGGTIGTVAGTADGIIFLTDGRRLRWDAVLWVTDETRSL